ncbi:MAG: response regulator [Candidatus Latescibacteria bacterium]|nr:response regulator [Candidatus Latescibacterota bacterium]
MEKSDAVKKILIVDDDIDLLLQLKMQLEAAGFEVISAESLEQAEKRLKEVRPDCAIVDLMMEHMDAGFTLSYHIKKIDSSIPVIMVTAVTRETGIEFDRTEDGSHSWLKADVVLAKPIRFEQLQHEIKRLLKG